MKQDATEFKSMKRLFKNTSKKEKKVIIGPKKKPIAVIKRSEIKNYLDDEYFKMYNFWYKWHLGFGLPFDCGWANHPAFLMDILEVFECEKNKAMNENRG